MAAAAAAAVASVLPCAAPCSDVMLGRWSAPLLAAALSTALLVPPASGSPGDRAHVFQSCLAKCVKVNCTQSEGELRLVRRTYTSSPGLPSADGQGWRIRGFEVARTPQSTQVHPLIAKSTSSK